MRFKKILSYLFNTLLLISLFYTLTFLPNNLGIYLKFTLLIIGFILFGISLLFKIFNKSIISRVFYLIFITYSVIIIGYFILVSLGIFNIFSSVTSLKEYILSTKELGVFTYIIIQASQVIFMPIPAAIICIVGSLIYGPWLGAIYCTVGILIGSYISYFLGRIFGRRLVSWVVGEDNASKYSEIIRKRGKLFLGLAFLLPMFPDDILCLIAGITDMKFSSFFWITLITRPIGVICMSYFGSGTIIPFTGWGIYAWIGILVLAIIAMVSISKYQDKMQNFILQKVFRKKWLNHKNFYF